jgi:hypothetical protein
MSEPIRGPVRERPGPASPAPPRRPPAIRWTPGAIARRRSLATARAELEAAEARGEPTFVLAAWKAVIAALVQAERHRDDPPRPDERHVPGCPARHGDGDCDGDCFEPLVRR